MSILINKILVWYFVVILVSFPVLTSAKALSCPNTKGTIENGAIVKTKENKKIYEWHTWIQDNTRFLRVDTKNDKHYTGEQIGNFYQCLGQADGKRYLFVIYNPPEKQENQR